MAKMPLVPPCDPESIRVLHWELKPNMLFYDCHARSQQQGEEVLRWLVNNT